MLRSVFTLRALSRRFATATLGSQARYTAMAPPSPNATSTERHDSRKRPFRDQRPPKRRKYQPKPVKEGSSEEVLLKDIRELLESFSLDDKSISNGAVNESRRPTTLPDPFTEVELTIDAISSTGDGLAVSADSKHIYVVPFTVPGDIVQAKAIRHFHNDSYTLTDFLHVIKPSPQRDDSRIRCPYFSTCSGCQFQMLSYNAQLAHKKTIVEKAYRNFSGLALEVVPFVGDTIGSPLQYGYRTKLTPHFDGPPGALSAGARRRGESKAFTEVPPIGFMKKGTRKTIDIEECPIGTDAVVMGLKKERTRVASEITNYKRGATILLRESTKRIPKDLAGDLATTEVEGMIRTETEKYVEGKTCVTDNNGTTTEYVDDFIFSNPANAFFQNNNSILPTFTAYIREHVLPKRPSSDDKPISYLIDAYSGSGLFTITLSSLFKTSMGIDIAASSIESAEQNARANNVPNARFIAADAAQLFKDVEYPPDETVVVIDPPRKGCDESFLSQLVRFRPRRVVYVSCNVHTQARDVGYLVGKMGAYDIESLRGFDFFPQTGHVEGVAVLTRKD